MCLGIAMVRTGRLWGNNLGLITIGTLYNPKQSNIPWSQPGGPGTIVYPQQQINIPYGFPAPALLINESTGLFSVFCGHWVDYPRIFLDDDGIVVTPILLKDSSGQIWWVTINNEEVIQTIRAQGAATNSVLVNDSSITQTWVMTVLTNGDIQLTPSVFANAPTQLAVAAPNGNPFGIQVANGDLQVAYLDLTNQGQPVAIIACALCSGVQYTMPQAQFFSTVSTPITII
jgi:hypothetical protein